MHSVTLPTKFNKTINLEEVESPETTDVLCGRGMLYATHPGNLFFNLVIRRKSREYADAPSRVVKSVIVASTVEEMTCKHNARFLRRDKKRELWFPLSATQVHEKTRHAIRDQCLNSSSPTTTPTRGSPKGERRSHKSIAQAKESQRAKKQIPVEAKSAETMMLLRSMQDPSSKSEEALAVETRTTQTNKIDEKGCNMFPRGGRGETGGSTEQVSDLPGNRSHIRLLSDLTTPLSITTSPAPSDISDDDLCTAIMELFDPETDFFG